MEGRVTTDLLCVGLTTVDIIARTIDRIPENEGGALIEGIEIVPAGTAAGAALVAARLGVKTALASAIGADRKGRFVRMVLEEEGVDTALLAQTSDYPTSATLLPIDSQGRRPTLHAMGASLFAEIDPRTLQAAQAARFVHWGGVGGVKLDGGPGEALLRAAKAAGAVVTLDLISPRSGALEELKRLLPSVDYFMPSTVEALQLAGVDTLEAAADFYLGLGAQACIFKNGGAGSYLALGGQRITLPAHDIKPVDTTSCGDSYCAGFIAALSRGWEPIDAARFATATAALVALGLGTLGALEDFDGVQAAMQAMPLRAAA
jgi:sugar/nucleoside kinase (ribokinase family)